MSHGPLQGLKVIEFAGIGPAPLAGMMLADMGAELTVVERPAHQASLGGGGALNRGKQVLRLDLKSPAGLQEARQRVLQADALIEGFRPGVMERLGLGPQALCAAQPRLVYARLTGWGQHGPLAQTAGHDLNYVALSGLLSLSARPGAAPTIPATVLGDVAGGTLTLLMGLLAALWEAQRSGRGQVIDAAMVDGLGYMGSLIQALRSAGDWPRQDSANLFMHQSPFYDCFACADGLWLSLAAIEPPFYAALMSGLGLQPSAAQMEASAWPSLRAQVATCLARQPRAHWLAVFAGSDACVAPVLTLDEAREHPHLRARDSHFFSEGQWWPRPAPRLSRTPLCPAGGARSDDTGPADSPGA